MAGTQQLNPKVAVRGLASRAMVFPLGASSVDSMKALKESVDRARTSAAPGDESSLLHVLSLALHAAHPILEGIGTEAVPAAAAAAMSTGARAAHAAGRVANVAGGVALPLSAFAETFIGLSEMGQASREGQAQSTLRSVLGTYSSAYADELARIAVGRHEPGTEPVPLWDTSRLTTGGLQIWQVLGWYDAHQALAALGDKATVVLDHLVDTYATRDGIETALRGSVADTCAKTADPDLRRGLLGRTRDDPTPDRAGSTQDFQALTRALESTPTIPTPREAGDQQAPGGKDRWDDDLTTPERSDRSTTDGPVTRLAFEDHEADAVEVPVTRLTYEDHEADAVEVPVTRLTYEDHEADVVEVPRPTAPSATYDDGLTSSEEGGPTLDVGSAVAPEIVTDDLTSGEGTGTYAAPFEDLTPEEYDDLTQPLDQGPADISQPDELEPPPPFEPPPFEPPGFEPPEPPPYARPPGAWEPPAEPRYETPPSEPIPGSVSPETLGPPDTGIEPPDTWAEPYEPPETPWTQPEEPWAPPDAFEPPGAEPPDAFASPGAEWPDADWREPGDEPGPPDIDMWEPPPPG